MTERPTGLAKPGEDLGDQAPCQTCAARFALDAAIQHGLGGLNTLIVAVELFVETNITLRGRAEVFQAIAKSMQHYAAQSEAEAAGVAMGPAQGRA